MKKFLTFCSLFFVFTGSFIIAFPKESIYAILQKQLQKQGIEFVSQEVKPSPLSLALKNASVAYKGVTVAYIDSVYFSFFKVEAKGILPYGTDNDALIPKIAHIILYFKPGNFFELQSHMANAKGVLDIAQRKILFTIYPKERKFKKYIFLLKNFKKEGEHYVFQYNF